MGGKFWSKGRRKGGEVDVERQSGSVCQESLCRPAKSVRYLMSIGETLR